jgi:riboflavin synthase
MFTGLVEHIGRIASLRELTNAREFGIEAPGLVQQLSPGDSVAIDGICLTVSQLADARFHVQAVSATLERTTACHWQTDRPVHLERALRAGDPMGGHFVQGHVDAIGEVLQLERDGDKVQLDILLPEVVAEVTVLHGSITVNGVSLTVSELGEADVARIALIPHTLKLTTLGRLRPGDAVNLEGDVIGRYVVSYLKRWSLPALG